VLTRWHPDDDRDHPETAARAREIAGLTPRGWRVLPLRVDHRGARVERVGPQVSSG
jgi:homoserine kinase